MCNIGSYSLFASCAGNTRHHIHLFQRKTFVEVYHGSLLRVVDAQLLIFIANVGYADAFASFNVYLKLSVQVRNSLFPVRRSNYDSYKRFFCLCV